MKFEDLKLTYNNEDLTIPANKSIKLFRAVNCLAKIEYMVNAIEVMADEPWLFSDAYYKSLQFTSLDMKEVSEDDVLMWMQSDDSNIDAVLQFLTKVKQLLNPPKEIQDKIPASAKKKKK